MAVPAPVTPAGDEDEDAEEETSPRNLSLRVSDDEDVEDDFDSPDAVG